MNLPLISRPRREDLFYPFEQVFNKLFDDYYRDENQNAVKSRVGFPRLDVIESDDHWTVEVAVPGSSEKDVEVEILPDHSQQDLRKKSQVTGRLLKISGQMSDQYQYGEEDSFRVKELRRSFFERVMSLPEHLQGEPDATMKDGILRLRWKTHKGQNPPDRKLIEVKKA